MDVYVLRGSGASLEVLVLRRAVGWRSAGSWECVHGHIDEGETPVQAAVGEMEEETGLKPTRLYNLSRVESFYSHRRGVVLLIPAFGAFVDSAVAVALSREHDRAEWLTPAVARLRVAWPRIRRGLDDAASLLGDGHAGALEDVLRTDLG